MFLLVGLGHRGLELLMKSEKGSGNGWTGLMHGSILMVLEANGEIITFTGAQWAALPMRFRLALHALHVIVHTWEKKTTFIWFRMAYVYLLCGIYSIGYEAFLTVGKVASTDLFR